MKAAKRLLVLGAAFLLAGCSGTNKGAALSVENAKDYLAYPEEGVGNGNFDADAKTVTFNIYPNSAKGKLFSSDIQGKCNISVKYCLEYIPGSGFVWSDPYEMTDVALTYKAGTTNPDTGSQTLDSLEGTFAYDVDFSFSVVNVFSMTVTEISGHMQA